MGDIDAIYSLARRYNLRVVEDAAHAFGTSYCGKKIGSFGDIICFSFDGIKSITCGEGGAVVTKNRLVAEHIKNARLLGVQKDTERRFAEERSWQFDVEYQGYRYHMSNLCAALGLTQLSRFDSYLKPRRQELAKRYNEKLSDVKGIELFEDEYNETVPHMFPIKVNGAMRDKLRDFLSENNIETGIHYYPNHLLTYYGKGKIKLPVTEDLYGRLLTLPLHPELSDNDIDYIADRIRDFYKK
jgi:dTDP-4-amino-4,6-dideoxygalactose transaminase